MSSHSFELYGGDDVHERIIPPPLHEARYQFETYIPRALLNSLGPSVVLAGYALIVRYYLLNTSPSGIISPRLIDPRLTLDSFASQ